jgi:hypothetical protein
MSSPEPKLPPRYGVPVIGPLRSGWGFDALTRTRYSVVAPPAGDPAFRRDEHSRWFIDAYIWAQIVAESLPASARVEVVRARFGRTKTVAVSYGTNGDMIE